jgi:hypothetical protein
MAQRSGDYLIHVQEVDEHAAIRKERHSSRPIACRAVATPSDQKEVICTNLLGFES